MTLEKRKIFQDPLGLASAQLLLPWPEPRALAGCGWRGQAGVARGGRAASGVLPACLSQALHTKSESWLRASWRRCGPQGPMVGGGAQNMGWVPTSGGAPCLHRCGLPLAAESVLAGPMGGLV